MTQDGGQVSRPVASQGRNGMTIYVEAFRSDGSQILGNLDMQTSYIGVRDHKKTQHYKCLKTGNYRVSRAVSFWRVVDSSGRILETIKKKD